MCCMPIRYMCLSVNCVKFIIDKKLERGIMGHKFKRAKARKRRVHSENSYRESPVAAKEMRQKEWKMVLEPRTERRIL